MPAGLTMNAVLDEALQQVASQTTVETNAVAAAAGAVIYAPTVQLMLREIQPDFARLTAALVASGGAPVPPWPYTYTYPADCVRLRQVRPPGSGTGSLADPNDPQPIRANVAVQIISMVPTKVILTEQINALAVYTSSNVTEAQWDTAFLDSVVRRLANPLAMALSGRPDFAKEILMQSAQMAHTAEAIDEGGFRRGM